MLKFITEIPAWFGVLAALIAGAVGYGDLTARVDVLKEQAVLERSETRDDLREIRDDIKTLLRRVK